MMSKEYFVGRQNSGQGFIFRAKGATVIQVVRVEQRPLPLRPAIEWVELGEATPPGEALAAAEDMHGLDLHAWERRDGVTASVKQDHTNVWWVGEVRYIRTGRLARRPRGCGGTHPTAELARADAADWAVVAEGAEVRWI